MVSTSRSICGVLKLDQRPSLEGNAPVRTLLKLISEVYFVARGGWMVGLNCVFFTKYEVRSISVVSQLKPGTLVMYLCRHISPLPPSPRFFIVVYP